MLIGILSDTHGRFDAAKLAVEQLRSRGVRQLIHCGDVGGERILDLLAGEVPAAFVFGNNDYDHEELARYAEAIGVTCLHTFGELELANKRIAVTHGDDGRRVRQTIDEQQHDYLFVGHSHVMTDQRFGRTRLINPGALYRAATKSVAVLDLSTDGMEFWTVTAT